MLSSFYSVVKKQIGPMVRPLGFRCHSRYYYRIIQDVVQQFCPLCLSHNVTIRFAVHSVYEDNRRISEGDEVMRLIDGTNGWLISAYTETAPQQYAAQEAFGIGLQKHTRSADICAEVLRTYLLPWFEANTDSEKAYLACRAAGLFSPAGLEQDSIKSLGFLLGMREWERAGEVLRPYIEHTVSCNQHWWSEKAPEYTELYDALCRKDIPCLRDYMESKRENTCREFRWKSS